ncbi:MAG TPA: hypothetical protein VL749_06985 [Patescibacteria group bacterium]|nr:hypothetical protein [Patescibacteria group bacterium]
MSGNAEEVALCVSNSLGWYQAVLRTHGLSGTLTDGIWACRGRVPPYYSNAMTVAPGWTAARAKVLLDLAADLERPFSVKDSFAAMDAAAGNMRELFNAEWVLLDPSTAPPETEPREVAWHRVTGALELDRWETAWRENGSPADTRVFLPALIKATGVALFAAYRDGRIVGGCAANRTPGAVGLSNVFAEADEVESVVAEALAQTVRFAPGMPVVGYESGDELARFVRLGFRPVGPLRILLVSS